MILVGQRQNQCSRREAVELGGEDLAALPTCLGVPLPNGGDSDFLMKVVVKVQ